MLDQAFSKLKESIQILEKIIMSNEELNKNTFQNLLKYKKSLAHIYTLQGNEKDANKTTKTV